MLGNLRDVLFRIFVITQMFYPPPPPPPEIFDTLKPKKHQINDKSQD